MVPLGFRDESHLDPHLADRTNSRAVGILLCGRVCLSAEHLWKLSRSGDISIDELVSCAEARMELLHYLEKVALTVIA